MKILDACLLCLSFACSPLFAKCLTNDTWRGADKQAHFAGGAAVAAVVAMHTADPWRGFGAGVLAGAAKEALDASGSGTCSLQDFLATSAGAAVGALTGGFIVTRVQGRTQLLYAKEF